MSPAMLWAPARPSSRARIPRRPTRRPAGSTFTPLGPATSDGTGAVGLSWTVAGSPASLGVVRKQRTAPVDATDGTLVFAGTGTTAREAAPELNPLETSNYAVFACNPCGDCEASGARAT